MKRLLLGLLLLVLPTVSSAQAKGKYDEMLDVTAYGLSIDEDWVVGLFGKGRTPACIDSAVLQITIATANVVDERQQPYTASLLLKADSALYTIEGKGQPGSLLHSFANIRYTFSLTREQLVALRRASVVLLRFVDGVPDGKTHRKTFKADSWRMYLPDCLAAIPAVDSAQRQ
jgi:hypothetical protein